MGGTLRGQSTLLIAACAGLFINCGAASPTGPDPTTLPTGIILTGAWLGSLTRAIGLDPIAVGWVTKPGGSFSITNLTFVGPVTLTHATDRLAGSLNVTLVGTAASPSLSLALNVDAGDAASTLKSCAVRASVVQVTTVTDTLIVAKVSASFSGCDALLNGGSSVTETDTLTLEKRYTR